MTLRELWEKRGLSPTQLAGLASITTTTLYKMNRREQVASRTVAAVCNALGISRQEYAELEPEERN